MGVAPAPMRILRAAVVVLCAGLIFVRMEQSGVEATRRNQQHVAEQNADLKAKGEELTNIKKQLQEDEDE